MEVSITPDAPEPVAEHIFEVADEPTSVKQDTPLFSLKNRRKEILNALYRDLKVPRYSDPEIYVRYAPIDAVKMGKALDRRSKQKGESGKVLDDWGIRANADILINSCVGIYMVFSDAPDEKLSLREGDPNGTWTKFDTDLADAMGFDVDRSDAAVSCVRSLYMTDGDLGDATDKLMKFSNMSNGEADEAF